MSGSDIFISLGIFVGYILLCLYIGYRAYTGSMKELSFNNYFIANKSLNSWMGTGTYMATLFSAFTFLGAVGIMYQNGMDFNNLILGEIFMMGVLMPLVGYPFWKLGRKYNYVTPGDAVADRYEQDKIVRILVGVGSVLFIFFFIGVQIVGIAYIVQALSGGLLPYGLIVWMMAAVLAIYITMGGLYSVTLTDVLQIVVVAIALVSVFFALFTQDFAGHATAALTGPKADIAVTKSSLLKWLSSFIAFGTGLFFWPHMWQRTFAVEKKVSLWWMAMGMMAGTLLLTFAFTYPVALWGAGEWPTVEALGTTPDQILIKFTQMALPTALAAIVLAGATAASMSTIDSQILTLTSIIQRDLYEVPFNVKIDEVSRVWASRVLTVILIVLTSIAALYPPPLITGLVIDTAYPGFCGMAPAIVLGLYWRRANTIGARWSIFTGMLTALIIIAAGKIDVAWLAPFKDLFGLGLYPGMWAMIVGTIVMVVVSSLTQPSSQSTLQKFGFTA